MKLNNLLKQNKEEAFIYLERNVNDIFPADVNFIYKPHEGVDKFGLPFILLDNQEAEIFETNPDPSIKEWLFKKDKIKFFIHPEMLPVYRNRGVSKLIKPDGYLNVSPTSSTRTVFTRDIKHNFMIKTNIEKKLGDSIRRLKKKHVLHSQKIAEEFERNPLPKCFSYLPESIGIVYSLRGVEGSMIIRELTPRPHTPEKSYILPFFSLTSQDKNNKNDIFLLQQILENVSSKDGNEFDLFCDKILVPFMDIWSYFVLELGMCLEMHPQNTLLEIDDKGLPKRIIYRDFQDVFIDPKIRKMKKLHCNFEKNIIGQPERKYRVENKIIKDSKICGQISYSLTYDYRIGRTLDCLYYAIKKYPSCTEEKFISAVKDIWGRYFSKSDIFPEKAYLLKKSEDSMEKELSFIETKPKYRP